MHSHVIIEETVHILRVEVCMLFGITFGRWVRKGTHDLCMV